MKKSFSYLIIIVVLALVLPVTTQAAQLIPGGQLIGLELSDQSVTVIAFDERQSAARSAGMEVGDRITHVDDHPIGCAEDLRQALERSDGSVHIRFLRQDKE